VRAAYWIPRDPPSPWTAPSPISEPPPSLVKRARKVSRVALLTVKRASWETLRPGLGDQGTVPRSAQPALTVEGGTSDFRNRPSSLRAPSSISELPSSMARRGRRVFLAPLLTVKRASRETPRAPLGGRGAVPRSAEPALTVEGGESESRNRLSSLRAPSSISELPSSTVKRVRKVFGSPPDSETGEPGNGGTAPARRRGGRTARRVGGERVRREDLPPLARWIGQGLAFAGCIRGCCSV
jgi:hypothetical protein